MPQFKYNMDYSKIHNGPKILASFLVEVSTLTKNHELFLRHFGFIENVFKLNLVEFFWVLGIDHPYFKFKQNLNMMQQPRLVHKQS